jgi:hypothetical protein
MLPPTSQIGPIPAELRQQIMKSSPVAGRYDTMVDRESAYEKLQARTVAATPAQAPTPGAARPRKNAKPEPTGFDQVLKAANSPLGRQIGRELARGLMGALLGTKR